MKINNKSSRILKLEYLRENWKTVAKGTPPEAEIISTENCKQGDIVWVLEENDTFTKAKIF